LKRRKRRGGLKTGGADHLLGKRVDASDAALGVKKVLELVRLLVQHLLLRRDHRGDRARVGPAARLDQGSGRGLEGDELHGSRRGWASGCRFPRAV
jgi:hypothetical protein